MKFPIIYNLLCIRLRGHVPHPNPALAPYTVHRRVTLRTAPAPVLSFGGFRSEPGTVETAVIRSLCIVGLTLLEWLSVHRWIDSFRMVVSAMVGLTPLEWLSVLWLD